MRKMRRRTVSRLSDGGAVAESTRSGPSFGLGAELELHEPSDPWPWAGRGIGGREDITLRWRGTPVRPGVARPWRHRSDTERALAVLFIPKLMCALAHARRGLRRAVARGPLRPAQTRSARRWSG
jgi:hypothetical protein